MNRTARTFLAALRRRGPAWLPRIASRMIRLRRSGFPRGLQIEPTTVCSGGCPCCVPSPPAFLLPGALSAWIESAPVLPATYAFVGKHSDPLCSHHLAALVEAVGRASLLSSISTIGLGFRAEHLAIPVDRWIVSLPGATGSSYAAVRGVDSLAEVLDCTRSLMACRSSQLEVALTIWKPSAGDSELFLDMARAEGWADIQMVQGIYDPTGHDVGRPGMLATGFPDSLYRVDGERVERIRPKGSCPCAGYLFLDAGGALRPCLFADSGPCWTEPSRDSWLAAAAFERTKTSRPFPECEWCP